MEKKILINGKEIKRLEDLPEHVRNILSDNNNNGIPDIAENPLAMFGKLGDISYLMRNMGNMAKKPESMQGQKKGEEKEEFTINGKKYNSWAEVPENEKMEVRGTIQHFTNLGNEGPIAGTQQGAAAAGNLGGSNSVAQIVHREILRSKNLSSSAAKNRPSRPPEARLTTFSSDDKKRIALIFIAGLFILYFFFNGG